MAKLLLSGVPVPDQTIRIDIDAKGFTFNGKSIGSPQIIDKDRMSKINELTKATQDVKDAVDNMSKNKEDN